MIGNKITELLSLPDSESVAVLRFPCRLNPKFHMIGIFKATASELLLELLPTFCGPEGCNNGFSGYAYFPRSPELSLFLLLYDDLYSGNWHSWTPYGSYKWTLEAVFKPYLFPPSPQFLQSGQSPSRSRTRTADKPKESDTLYLLPDPSEAFQLAFGTLCLKARTKPSLFLHCLWASSVSDRLVTSDFTNGLLIFVGGSSLQVRWMILNNAYLDGKWSK